MKKKILISLVFVFVTGILFAGSINLGDFPLGKWLDSNYSAIWEFSTSNIKITAPDGTVYCDFDQKTIENFKVSASMAGPSITFSCPETGRAYKFTKSLTNMDMTMVIQRDGKPDYTVVMKKQ